MWLFPCQGLGWNLLKFYHDKKHFINELIKLKSAKNCNAVSGSTADATIEEVHEDEEVLVAMAGEEDQDHTNAFT